MLNLVVQVKDSDDTVGDFIGDFIFLSLSAIHSSGFHADFNFSELGWIQLNSKIRMNL